MTLHLFVALCKYQVKRVFSVSCLQLNLAQYHLAPQNHVALYINLFCAGSYSISQVSLSIPAYNWLSQLGKLWEALISNSRLRYQVASSDFNIELGGDVTI